ncbi:probable beta-D-xylosidase 2 [Impatiens glandulifera]|uniref:probable beta-D-xylosidase 2 n=1 Tax=Impatiens glandulifera TaxID=253017 RepID=UPI001FB09417|nr:probable beta-D-xylosidase 2 [Impatiens glandulifera]
MNFSTFLFLLFLSVAGAGASREPFACNPTDPATKGFKFCRSSIPIPDRVKDLIGRLTLQEKVKLLVNKAAAVPRLGIRGYEWWSEALHGVSNVGPGTKFGGQYPGATSFPQVITTAASFNATLWEDIGRVVSDEARAMYNGGMAGLTFWSPNINIFRDPRWGRGQETPGEDPVVAGRYASSYVRGLQGSDENRLKVAACCKHYTAYDLDNWSGVDRFHFNAKVSKQDIVDTFDVPFRECVMQGKVASVMCSYNQVNGVPTCADPKLLRGTIRGSWHLNGYIVSDCDSVGVFYENQHYTSTPEEAAAAAIKAGLDLDCGPFLAIHTEEAINKGILQDTDINNALFNTITVQMRLGMFNTDETDQFYYTRLTSKDVCTPSNQDLALQAARQGIVLLKNRGKPGSTLPLSHRRHRTVAVIGPNADATLTMIGNYAGLACGYTSPLRGIERYARVVYREGCSGGVSCVDDSLFDGAVEAAREADATVVVMGLDQSVEAEFRDRVGLLLPGRQQELVEKVGGVCKGPMVLVLMSGGPIDVSFAEDDPRVNAIVWAGYPGQAGGTAIADILFGAHNPEGKLPMTWYHQDYLSKLPMTTMDMRPDPKKGYPGRTYRFYEGPVVYPFGHGLGYSDFSHTIVEAPSVVSVPLHGHRGNNSTYFVSGKAIRVTHARCDGLSLTIRVDVRNLGHRDGAHTLLVFSTPPSGRGHWAPRRQLVAFEKVHVPGGGERRVNVNIHLCKYLSVVDRSGIRRIPLGKHNLHVGSKMHVVSLQADTIGIVKS